METLIVRLRKRAALRRQIPSRKSVQEGKPDRLADLLEEAATELENLETIDKDWETFVTQDDNEYARYLASFLKQNEHLFVSESVVVDPEDLYRQIRRFQEELP